MKDETEERSGAGQGKTCGGGGRVSVHLTVGVSNIGRFPSPAPSHHHHTKLQRCSKASDVLYRSGDRSWDIENLEVLAVGPAIV